MEPFLGTSQYTNCKGEETEVEIACDTTDDAAPATTTTREICMYSEHPVQYDDAAATATTSQHWNMRHHAYIVELKQEETPQSEGENIQPARLKSSIV